MPGKKNLTQMLVSDDPATGQPDDENGAEDKPPKEESTSAQMHISTSAQPAPKRTTRGYRLRDDLIKQCKRIAVEEERKLYEVMEEALEEYLSRKKQ